MNSDIHFKEHLLIDKEKWDRCIEKSDNSLVFGLSWYLDRISPGWCALVKGNYEAVLPLVCKKKYFINYIYHPYFTSRFDIFSNLAVDEDLIIRFLKAVPGRFKLIEIKLNSSDLNKVKGFEISKLKTYELNIHEPYVNLRENFSSNHKRNIDKAYSFNLRTEKTDSLENYIKLSEELLKKTKKINVKKKHFDLIFNTLNYANTKGYCDIYDVYDEENRVCGSGCFLKYSGRAVKYTATNYSGKKKNCGYLLIDKYMKEKAGTKIILDFAGSNIEQIAYFNKGFGGREKIFDGIYTNRLPYPLRVLKK